MDWLEHTVLANGQFIGGSKLSVADIHAIWGLRWGLNAMDSNPPGLGAQKEPGLGKDSFPKVWRLIESLPANLEGIMKDDPTGLKAGTQVTIDSLE